MVEAVRMIALRESFKSLLLAGLRAGGWSLGFRTGAFPCAWHSGICVSILAYRCGGSAGIGRTHGGGAAPASRFNCRRGCAGNTRSNA